MAKKIDFTPPLALAAAEALPPAAGLAAADEPPGAVAEGGLPDPAELPQAVTRTAAAVRTDSVTNFRMNMSLLHVPGLVAE